MRQRSILPIGLLLSCGAIGLAPPVLAKSAPPVVRASGFTKQVPLCYIQTTNSGLQNLDAACLMGKVPESTTIDMVTDRDKDGVPDELAAFFKQMDRFDQLSANPETRQAEAAQMQKAMKALGQRAPLAPELKANFNELADTMYELAKASPNGGKPSPQMVARLERMGQVMQKLNKDPFMQKLNQYSNRYNENKWSKYRTNPQ